MSDGGAANGGVTGARADDHRVDHGPARITAAASVGAALLTAVAVGWYSADALLVGVAGVALTLGGLGLRRRVGIVAGALVLVAGVLLGGVRGAPTWSLLVGIAGALVAWDAGETALGLGRQLGRAAPATRLELVHLAGGLAVATLSAGVGYAVYRVATGGQPVAALLALLLAGALLVRALAE